MLFDKGATFDVLKAATNGRLADISGVFPGDDTLYVQSLFDSCKFGDKLYFLPLSFSLQQAYTTASKLTRAGVSLEELNYAALSKAVCYESDRIGADITRAGLMDSSRVTSLSGALYRALQTSGIELIDYASMSATDDKEGVRAVCDIIKSEVDHKDNIKAVSAKNKNDFVGAIDVTTFLLEDTPLDFTLRYYAAYYGMGLKEEPVVYERGNIV